jgi:hypothetical protein
VVNRIWAVPSTRTEKTKKTVNINRNTYKIINQTTNQGFVRQNLHTQVKTQNENAICQDFLLTNKKAVPFSTAFRGVENN